MKTSATSPMRRMKAAFRIAAGACGVVIALPLLIGILWFGLSVYAGAQSVLAVPPIRAPWTVAVLGLATHVCFALFVGTSAVYFAMGRRMNGLLLWGLAGFLAAILGFWVWDYDLKTNRGFVVVYSWPAVAAAVLLLVAHVRWKLTAPSSGQP